MKRKMFYALLGLAFVTGCGNKKAEEVDLKSYIDKSAAFSITCSLSDESNIETETTTVYNFNEEQYVTSYSTITTQKFDDKATYEEYKKAQEGTVSDTSEDVVYSLISNDKSKTLVFVMTIKNIDINNADDEEEKESLRASSMLETSKSHGSTCDVEGIDESELN